MRNQSKFGTARNLRTGLAYQLSLAIENAYLVRLALRQATNHPDSAPQCRAPAPADRGLQWPVIVPAKRGLESREKASKHAGEPHIPVDIS
jgi:hypothetical protein